MTSDRTIALSTTVSKMQSRQLFQTIKRKAKSTLYPHIPVSLDEIYQSSINSENIDFTVVQDTNSIAINAFTENDHAFLRQQLESLEQGTVVFLNRSVESGADLPFSIDPHIGEQRGYPRLWTLKLLSFEPAAWLAVTSSDKTPLVAETLVAWLTSWSSSEITSIGSPDYLRRYWAPYVVSRRIVNLAMLGAVLDELSNDTNDIVAEHLAKNVRFLCDHVEYDIGGNHLLENACALVVGGVLLDDNTVISRGTNILASELSLQLLDDGMHFERSPMYHTALLYRIAWSLNVLRQSGRKLPAEVVSYVRSMYAWLQNVAPSGANYPLLNDSVYREAPSRQSCLSFVDCIIDAASAKGGTSLSGKSGYYIVKSGSVTILVDGGVPCPPHLPAHAHNDIGNFVLWIDGEPVITDTGVYDYQPGDRRDYARSVTAHNTVQIGNNDQAVIYGRFMMGPRSTPESGYVDFGSIRGVRIRYDSPKFAPSYSHERSVKPINNGIQIEDRVSTDERLSTSRIHLAPGTNATSNESTVDVNTTTGTHVEVTITGVDSLNVIETEYYPEYGVTMKRPTIEASLRPGTGEACFTHKIRHQKKRNDE